MNAIEDPIRAGLRRGWRILGGPHGRTPERLECDVVIVGTGAGGGVTAELLARAGLDVALVEEGPLRSSADFRQLESDAYPQLYQESAARKTADKAINILQGRCVGGSTTVNWTSSFRTPPATLEFWRVRFGLSEMNVETLAPWFEQAERRHAINPWPIVPNENNEVLRRGAGELGIATRVISRNVKGCFNLGSCGLGCPTNAKQSMLLTTVPAALDRGSRMLVETHVERILFDGSRAVALDCVAAERSGGAASGGARTRITARHFVVAGGAINSPALLLRSSAPDPHRLLGGRTFLHPVVLSSATFEQRIAAWDGAPQSIYTDHFLETQPIDGPIGFKLEVPPMHPVIASSTLPGFGPAQSRALERFPHTQAMLALMRDGFHDDAPGGRVSLRDDGSPLLDYPLTAFIMEGARRALLAMAEIQFAAGAQTVTPLHELARPYATWAEAKSAIAALPMKPLLTRVVSAHVMGGCGMAASEHQGVVRPDGTHWQVGNLSVFDGSIFPTSIGANPQLSIYGIVGRLAAMLARRLGGADARIA